MSDNQELKNKNLQEADPDSKETPNSYRGNTGQADLQLGAGNPYWMKSYGPIDDKPKK